jgi:serine phosphatase RsbU (regulator of sigma subunit)/ligand-binding sensor domain-containing protein
MNKTMRLIFNINIAILILANFVSAQTKISTELISVRDGLSSNNIRDITQDRFGYIWICTNDGVNIYDGYQFKVLKNIQDDTTSLADNNTYRVLEDSHGTMWVVSSAGLSKYNRKKVEFENFFPSGTAGDFGNQTYKIHEDSKNKLWVSTSEGLLEFDRDKEKFIRYDVMLTDNSIANFVNFGGDVNENNKGELYTNSTSWGLLKFDYKASLFVVIPLKKNFNDKISGILNTYASIFDGENNLWLACSNGLLKIDIENKTGFDFTPFKKRNIVSNRRFDNAASGLFLDKDQNIWVGTSQDGLYLYKSKEQKFEKLLSASAFFYSAFFEDKSGILWFASSRGIMRYDPDKKPFETFKLPNQEMENNASSVVLSFSESQSLKNQVWLGTSSGIMFFDIQKNIIYESGKKFKKLDRLKNISINDISETSDAILWVSTTTAGLYSYNLKSNELKNYVKKEYDYSTLFNNNVHVHQMDNFGNLWLGTQQGLNLLPKNENRMVLIPSFMNRQYSDGLFGKIKSLRENTNPTSSIIRVGDFADLSREFVLREDSKVIIYSVGEGLPAWNMADFGWLESEEGDTLWSAGQLSESFYAGGGLKNRIKIGLLELKIGRYKLRYKSDDSHSVESYNTTPPQDSIFWGTQIYSLESANYSMMQELLEESNNKTYISDEDIKTIYIDSKNNTWVGTDIGLSKIDSNYIIKNYVKDADNTNSISDNFVRDIGEDNRGNIWIATSNGLNKLNPDNDKFTIFTEKDGLPSSNLRSIEVDNNGYIWVGGLKGISKFELDDDQSNPVVVNYDVKDGLQGYEFINRSSMRDKRGKLYFSGVDGFNSFYPGSSNRTPPFLALQDVRISNKSINDMEDFDFQDLNSMFEIFLNHDQNDLSFEFASIHFSRPDKNRIMYKMEGADEDWIITNRRFASYTNLRPGDYTFALKGSNGDGIWSEEIKKINIHIAAPWYNNWVAYIIYVALFFGILYGFRRFEMGRQQKNSKIKESQLRAEAAESKAKASEAQALVVQAENERKSQELEEARQLQLSMLPKELPQLPHLDIAVYMQTATEVGGDYYDFHVSMDGTLTVVVGDATGHGMKAGTMVTTAKTLFKSYASNPDILFSFNEFTRCIKEMNFGKLSMCLTMLKIKGDKMQISTAGMPPSFIFRRDTRVVEEHLFKAMPLGTMEKFPYEIKDTTLNPGDTILLMSDGLPELENSKGEMYGYKRIRNSFEEVAEKSPEDITSYLKNEGSSWVNDEAPDDDVTFVVIKVK